MKWIGVLLLPATVFGFVGFLVTVVPLAAAATPATQPATPVMVTIDLAERPEPYTLVLRVGGRTLATITVTPPVTAPTSQPSLLDRIRAAFGSRPGDPTWDASLDLDGDGVIGVSDVTAAMGTQP